MVIVTEVSNSLWGTKLEAGKSKEHKLSNTKPLLILMAALDTKVPSDEYVRVFVKSSDSSSESYLLCTLNKPHQMQQKIEMGFNAGENVAFYLDNEKGAVHLTGIYENEPPACDHEGHDHDGQLIHHKGKK
jgi:hypothetical protein